MSIEEYSGVIQGLITRLQKEGDVELRTLSTSLLSVHISHWNMFIEVDDPIECARGVLDDLSVEQIRMVTNALEHNERIRRMGGSLVRIWADDLTTLFAKQPNDNTWLNDLIVSSHHLVHNGTVVKEGSFRLNDERQSVITRETLIRTNELEYFPSAPGRSYTEKILLPIVRNFFRAHVAYWGWFYPTSDDDVADVLSTINRLLSSSTDAIMQSETCLASRSTAGSTWLKSFIRSFWNVDKGPIVAFNDDKKFESVLKYRLGLNTSKPYSYKLSDGTHVSCRETFDINIRNVRFGLIVQRNSVSWFRPSTAGSIYKKMLGNNPHPKVWDPSGGFGARMLGFAALYPRGHYVCCEPASMTGSDLEDLANVIQRQGNRRSLDIKVHRIGSEKFIPDDPETFDLVFTSPPYFDKERYFDEPGQCWKEFPTIKLWINDYLVRTFETAYVALKRGAHMVINIDSKNEDIIIDAALSVGFVRAPEHDMRLVTGRDHFNRSSGHVDSGRSEPIICFMKP